jgi:Tol biopolymer transport system component
MYMLASALRRSIIPAILAVCVVATAAHSQYFGRNKIQYKDHHWKVLSTPHFDIHFYQGSESFAARAGLVLEDGYDMLSYKLKEVLPWRVPVILYSSHNDFLQTNVTTSLLPEGVQAFAEPSRRRIVLPFTSSFKEFSHTAVHELSHVFTFYIVYNRMLDNVFTRSYVFPMELWVAEGVAEYLAVKWDPDADMYIRDAVIQDYLFPLQGLSGYYVYKEGQSVFNYIEETYGRDKVVEILHALANTRSADVALERTIGLNTGELQSQWAKSLRKHYWPLYPDKVEVTDYGRRLTDHVRDHGYYNTTPVMSPDGEKIAFFSDRDGLVDIYVMSALDGKVIRRLVSGHRSNRYESLHFMNSNVTFSPDGKYVAFVAKSKGHDTVFIMDAESGEIRKKITNFDVGGMAAPHWSPLGDKIILSATYDGQTDLAIIDVETGEFKRLTNDPADQLTPRFFPDGNRVVFTYYPEITADVPPNFSGENLNELSQMNFLDAKNITHGLSYDIWEYDLDTGRSRPLVQSPGDDTSPLVMADGVTLIYTSDASGINNLYAGNLVTRNYDRVTDVLGGIFTPDINEQTGRITFSAFRQAGFDVYISDDLDGMLARRYEDQKMPPLAYSLGSTPYDSPGRVQEIIAKSKQARAAAAAAAESAAAESTAAESTAAGDTSMTGITGTKGTAVVKGPGDPAKLGSFVPPIRKASPSASHTNRQSPGNTMPNPDGVDRIRPSEGSTPPRRDNVEFTGGTVKPYKTRLSPDFIGQGAGVYFSTGFGFGMSNSIALSDMLGNHRLGLAFNLYSDISQSDFLVSYYYLKKRVDYGIGVYQFKNYFNSRVTSVGETFGSYRLFSERNFGLFGLASVPFSTYYRMDLELQAYMSFREFFDNAATNTPEQTLITTGKSTRRLLEPSISFVHDSSFWGYYWPVEGSRWRFSMSQGISFSTEDVSRSTVYLDYRWYKMLFYRNSFAFRLMGAVSEGRDPRVFFLGGPLTLRGYDYLQFEGNRLALAQLEYRFPLLDALIFGWPGRWGFRNVGGTVFMDAGSAWWNNDLKVFEYVNNVRQNRLQDLHVDFGLGMYLNLGYVLLNFQFAWPTDLYTTRDYQFHFYIGPAF